MATVLYDTGWGNGNALRTVVVFLPFNTVGNNFTLPSGISSTNQIVSVAYAMHNSSTGAQQHAYCTSSADSNYNIMSGNAALLSTAASATTPATTFLVMLVSQSSFV